MELVVYVYQCNQPQRYNICRQNIEMVSPATPITQLSIILLKYIIRFDNISAELIEPKQTVFVNDNILYCIQPQQLLGRLVLTPFVVVVVVFPQLANIYLEQGQLDRVSPICTKSQHTTEMIHVKFCVCVLHVYLCPLRVAGQSGILWHVSLQ